MSDLRDPAIKLFGRTIPLAEEDAAGGDLPVEELDKDFCEETNPEQPTNQNPDPSLDPVHREPTTSSDPAQEDSSLPDKAQSETETGTENQNQDKTLKKPDKILPCPRCNSLDTKFCYYNNYNVNQPRHFCKKCQRYWTAGGTMRNVPVGAGRRKNKHLNNRPQQFTTGTEPSEPVPIKVNTPNGGVVNFRPEPPFSESMVSVLNIKEHENQTGTSTGTVGSSGCSEEINGCNGLVPVPVPPVPFYPGAPFLYPWNGGAIPVPVPVQPPPGGTGFCPPAVPFPFVPASFWAFGWGPPPPQWAPSPTSSTSSGTGSTSLGKHKRDGTEKESPKNNLWVPKTLRIDDPKDAAKSSIWDTLGIKPDETTSGLRAFRGKNEMRENVQVRNGTSQVLRANPAALSRSQSFQEST
ncbi:hypothetical protein LUZ60_013191 [Juncus effusus]|nr:hypothetical protein LUZ60_013191 [Juncus effusus]